MADDLSTLVFTTASAAVITKRRGAAIIAFGIPAAVDNSAVRLGLEASFDGGTTYSYVAIDDGGVATNYRPFWAVSQLVVLDPTVIYAIQGARTVRVTLYAADGTTAASQTATTLGVVYAQIVER